MSKFKTVNYERIFRQVTERPGPKPAYIFTNNHIFFERPLREGVIYPWMQDLPPENDDVEP